MLHVSTTHASMVGTLPPKVHRQASTSADPFAQAQAQSPATHRVAYPAWTRRPGLVTTFSLRHGGPDSLFLHGYHLRQWVDEEAMKWASQGIDAAEAYTWHALGLSPVEAGRLAAQGRGPGDVIREWWSTGIPLVEVADWIGAGLTTTEAMKQRSGGITAEQAAALRALRQHEAAPKQDPSVRGQLIAPQGPPGSSVPGPPPDDEPTARSAVEDVFSRMLDVDGNDGSIPAIDGGEDLGEVLEAAAQRFGVGPDTQRKSVQLDGLRFVNDHEARVVYSVVITGPFSANSMIKGRSGRAILVDGQWKVARATFAAFMQIAGFDLPPRK